MLDKKTEPCRVEIQRIGGDIYLNGSCLIFAVDAGNNSNPTFDEVDWLIGWAKVGMMSKGHTVNYFPAGRKEDMDNRRDTSAVP